MFRDRRHADVRPVTGCHATARIVASGLTARCSNLQWTVSAAAQNRLNADSGENKRQKADKGKGLAVGAKYSAA